MVEFTCKCCACGKRFTLDEDQLDPEAVGCAISPCCNFPATVEKVKTTVPNRSGVK